TAHARIMRDLRAPEMLVFGNFIETQIIAGATGPIVDGPFVIELPENFIDIREISYSTGSRRINLKLVGRHQLNRFQSAGGSPAVYSLLGGAVAAGAPLLQVAPSGQPDTIYDVWFYAELVAPSPGTTNELITRYPYLYLYGALSEAFTFTQDETGIAISSQTYINEIDVVNNRSDLTRYGEAPVMQVVG
ncbi:MAG: hypothetical protein KAJ55_15940, partial [Anaerolineales bacterium]|nr:hypothetical protein [Anaerolineales bacterium]